MEQSEASFPFSSSSNTLVEEVEKQVKELLPSLPSTIIQGTTYELILYQGFWFHKEYLHSVISMQTYFQAQDTDIIVTSNPKCGTTWLKALVFCIVNKKNYTPLLTSNPHDLVPFLELKLFAENILPDLTVIPAPRLLSTHLPFSGLPESIKQSKCPIVYICRNPLDSAVSLWHQFQVLTNSEIPMEYFIDLYFKGISGYGPYWDHILGYWNESLEKPNKVLFLKYEDMKEDTISCLKRIAEFIRHPFSEEEEGNGIIEEIAKVCSFSNLKNLEVNKNGVSWFGKPNTTFFRKGEVGGWVDYLSPSKKQHLENLMLEKLAGSGLTFRLSTKD